MLIELVINDCLVARFKSLEKHEVPEQRSLPPGPTAIPPYSYSSSHRSLLVISFDLQRSTAASTRTLIPFGGSYETSCPARTRTSIHTEPTGTGTRSRSQKQCSCLLP
eukprot:scaffold5853_cov19-Prasinocladus_malaysianus.AAC.1